MLTGGYRPSPAVIDEIRAADLFSTLVSADTYHVASAVHDLLVKTHASDHEKIALIKRVVAEHIDVDRILAVAAEAAAERRRGPVIHLRSTTVAAPRQWPVDGRAYDRAGLRIRPRAGLRPRRGGGAARCARTTRRTFRGPTRGRSRGRSPGPELRPDATPESRPRETYDPRVEPKPPTRPTPPAHERCGGDCCRVEITIHAGGDVNIYTCEAPGGKPVPPRDEDDDRPTSPGACVPASMGAKPKQSQRHKLDTLLANTQVPSVLAASFLQLTRRYLAGKTPANQLEEDAFERLGSLSREHRRLLRCTAGQAASLSASDRDRLFEPSVLASVDTPVEPSALLTAFSQEIGRRAAGIAFDDSGCGTTERPGRIRVFDPGPGEHFSTQVRVCKINGLRTSQFKPQLQTADYLPQELEQRCEPIIVDGQPQVDCTVLTSDCPGRSTPDGTCLRVQDVEAGTAVLLEGANFFSVDGVVRLTARDPGTAQAVVDAIVCGDIDTPVTEVVDGQTVLIADCRVHDRLVFTVPADAPARAVRVQRRDAEHHRHPEPRHVRGVVVRGHPGPASLQRPVPDHQRTAGGARGDGSLVGRLRRGRHPDHHHRDPARRAAAGLRGPIVPFRRRRQRRVARHDADPAREHQPDRRDGDRGHRLRDRRRGRVRAADRQLHVDLPRPAQGPVAVLPRALALAFYIGGPILLTALPITMLVAAIGIAITLAVDIFIALWAPADLIIEDTIGWSACDLAMLTGANFPAPPVERSTSPGGIEVKAEPVSKGAAEYVERREYRSDDEDSRYSITFRYTTS